MSDKDISYDEYYAMMSRKYPEKKHLLVTPQDAKTIVKEIKNSGLNGKKDIKEMLAYIQNIVANNKMKKEQKNHEL